MHTTRITTAEDEIVLNHNSDWSGNVALTVHNFYGKPMITYQMPGWIFKAVMTHLLAGVKTSLQELMERCDWDCW